MKIPRYVVGVLIPVLGTFLIILSQKAYAQNVDEVTKYDKAEDITQDIPDIKEARERLQEDTLEIEEDLISLKEDTTQIESDQQALRGVIESKDRTEIQQARKQLAEDIRSRKQHIRELHKHRLEKERDLRRLHRARRERR